MTWCQNIAHNTNTPIYDTVLRNLICLHFNWPHIRNENWFENMALVQTMINAAQNYKSNTSHWFDLIRILLQIHKGKKRERENKEYACPENIQSNACFDTLHLMQFKQFQWCHCCIRFLIRFSSTLNNDCCCFFSQSQKCAQGQMERRCL